MKKLHKSRVSILLTLLIVSTFLMIFSSLPIALAGPYIPEESQYNGWHWGVDVGDELYFEAEFIVENYTSGEVVAMFRDIWIYNISSIENVTMEWLGIHEFSVVNATRCYYDLDAMKLMALYDDEEYAIFNYNESDSIHHRYRAGFSGIPQILPLNNSFLELDVLTPILNETMYTPLSELIFNQFDDYEFNPGDNSILFENSSDGYYAYGEYYGNNGTLKYAETSMLANMDGPMIINATFQRVFDYNITDEVDWGANVGDSIIYDLTEDSPDGEGYELNFTIKEIKDINYTIPFNSFYTEEEIPMVFQCVIADLYVWNGTDYDFDMADVPLGAANNFYPISVLSDPPWNMIITPISATTEDLEFMWNLDRLRIMGVPLDTIEINDNGELEFNISNSEGNDNVRGVIDKTTGFFKSFTWLMGTDFIYYEQKNMSIVNWHLKPGDTLHYKVNEDDAEDRIVRATVLGTFGYFINMTYLELASAGLYTLPSDQPEFQFFSAIIANFDVWNATSEAWELDASEEVFGMANIYWPICPLALGMAYGFPLIYPMDVEGSDFSGLFDIYSTIYDDITYGSNYVTLVNTTLSRTLNFHFDSTSGLLTYLGGWVNQPGGGSTGWSYTSVYPLNYENLTSGVSEIEYTTNFDIDVDFSVSLNVTSLPFEYYYSLFPFNPVDVPLPNGTALCYLDQIISHPSSVSGNVSMTIEFPTSICLATAEAYLFAWNVSGTSTWEIAPPDSYEVNVATNSIIVHYGAFSADSIISALSYKGGIPCPLTLSSNAGDPDDDGTFNLLWTEPLSADNYSIYLYSGYINSINSSLTLLADEITDLSLSLTDYTDGTYYFIVVAHNSYGDSLSNCILINVELSITTPTPGIPGYHLTLILLSMLGITILIVKSKLRHFTN